MRYKSVLTLGARPRDDCGAAVVLAVAEAPADVLVAADPRRAVGDTPEPG